MFFKCFDQCKIFNHSVMLFGITAFVMKIKIWPKSLQLCFGVFGSVPAMEGGDCSKGKVWVRQTGLACCFLFLQLALVVATFFYFYNIFILHSMQRHHRDGNINLLTKVTSLPHTAIQGIWRWKRLGVYLWSKIFPHKWQCLYRARASVWGLRRSKK